MGANPSSHLSSEVRPSTSAGAQSLKKSKKRWTWRNRHKFSPPEPDPLPAPLIKSPSLDLEGVPAQLGGHPHNGSNLTSAEVKQLKKEGQTEVELRLQNAAENANIRQLDLKGMNLKSVPKKVFELVNLTNLLLSNNLLAKLPRGIKNLTELHVLDLNSNKLTSLPPLGALVDLISLDLGKNRLISISKQAFEGLRNLEKLELYCNQLVDLPDEICFLSSLVSYISNFLTEGSSLMFIAVHYRYLLSLSY